MKRAKRDRAKKSSPKHNLSLPKKPEETRDEETRRMTKKPVKKPVTKETRDRLRISIFLPKRKGQQSG